MNEWETKMRLMESGYFYAKGVTALHGEWEARFRLDLLPEGSTKDGYKMFLEVNDD